MTTGAGGVAAAVPAMLPAKVTAARTGSAPDTRVTHVMDKFPWVSASSGLWKGWSE